MDPVAVKSARENVTYNNISNIKILHGNLMDVVSGKADIIVANIIADIIIPLCDTVKKVFEIRRSFYIFRYIKRKGTGSNR